MGSDFISGKSSSREVWIVARIENTIYVQMSSCIRVCFEPHQLCLVINRHSHARTLGCLLQFRRHILAVRKWLFVDDRWLSAMTYLNVLKVFLPKSRAGTTRVSHQELCGPMVSLFLGRKVWIGLEYGVL